MDSNPTPDESKLMGAEDLREHLQQQNLRNVGTDDFGEANRRYSVLFSWRDEK